MASVEPTRSKRRPWAVRWRDPDGRHRSHSVTTHAEARRLSREAEACEIAGKRWEPGRARGAPTLRDIAAAYITAQQGLLSAKTIRRYAGQLEEWIQWMEAEHPEPRPQLLTRRLLRDYHASMLTEKGPMGLIRAEATVQKHIAAIQQFWAWASEHDDEYDWEGLIPRPRTIRMRKLQTLAARAPTWKEMDAMIAQLPDDWRRQAGILLRFTGVRISAALNTGREALDLDAGLLRVEADATKGRYGGRVLPLSPHLVEVARSWPAYEHGRLIDAPISELDGGGHVGRYFSTAWEAAGVTRDIWEGHPTHALRKGVDTGLRRLGAEGDLVRLFIGHRLGRSEDPYVDLSRVGLERLRALFPPLGGPYKEDGDG